MRYRLTSEEHRGSRVHLGPFLVQFDEEGHAETDSREIVLLALKVPGFKVAQVVPVSEPVPLAPVDVAPKNMAPQRQKKKG